MNYNGIGIYKNAFTKEWCNKAIKWFNTREESGVTLSRQDRDKASVLDKKDT